MFSSRNRTLWQSLGFRLTAWFAGFFVLGFSLLLFVYSFFINTSLENSDRQAASLIASELKHVAEQGGLEALRTRSLALDNSERTDSFLVGLYNGKTTLFLKTPEKWREFDVDFASFGDEFDKSNQLNWQILPSQKSKDSIELLRTRLSDVEFSLLVKAIGRGASS